MRVLSIDVGTKKFGFAITDIKQKIITPLKHLELPRFEKNFLFLPKFLKFHFSSYWKEISVVVVGNSKDIDFPENKKIVKIQEQVKRILEAHTNWKIHFISEAWTTKEAYDIIKNQKQTHESNYKPQIDSFAAAIILRDFLFLKKIKNF